jgi:hypothetical protein
METAAEGEENAGFMMRVDGECIFIALRHNFAVEQLPRPRPNPHSRGSSPAITPLATEWDQRAKGSPGFSDNETK